MIPRLTSQARVVLVAALWCLLTGHAAFAEGVASDKLSPPKLLMEAGLFESVQGELAERARQPWAAVRQSIEPAPWPEADDGAPAAVLPVEAARLIKQSELAVGKGQAYRAVQLLQEAEAIAPDHPSVTRALGLAYAESGNLTRAAQYLRQVIANQPDDLSALVLLAQESAQVGRLYHALTYCNALEKAKAQTLADYYLALALAKQGYTTAASERLARALDAIKAIDLDQLNQQGQTPALLRRELAVVQQTTPQLRLQQGDWLLRSGAYEKADAAYASVERGDHAARYALAARRAYLALLADDRAAAVDHVLPLLAHPEAQNTDARLIRYLTEQGVAADDLAKRIASVIQADGITLPRLVALSRVADKPSLLKPINAWLTSEPVTAERLGQAVGLFSFDDRQPADAKPLSELLRLVASLMQQSSDDASALASAALEAGDAPVTLLRAVQSNAMTNKPTVYTDLLTAMAYESAGRLEDARDRYTKVYIAGQGLKEQVRHPLVRLLLALGQGEAALSLLGEPGLDTTLDDFELAVRAMAAADQAQEALALVEERITARGKQLELDALRIELIAVTGQPEQACNLLLRLISSHPDEESLYRLGIDLAYDYRTRFNRVTDADRMRRAFLSRLVSNLPDSLLAQMSMAQNIRSNPAKVSEAETILLSLLDEHPDHLGLLSLLVELYEDTGDEASAQAMFDRYAEALQPGVRRALIIAERAMELEQKQQAAKVLDEVLALDEEGVLPGPPITGDQASILLRYLDAVDAERDTEALYLAMIRRFPDHAGLNNALGYQWAVEDKNLLQAKAMIERALKDNPTSHSILDSLAWVQYKLGKFDQAQVTQSRSLMLLEELLARFRGPGLGLPEELAAEFGATTAILNDHMGDILYRQGETRKALDHWRVAQKQPYTEEEMRTDPELRTLAARLKAKIDAMAAERPVPVADVPGVESHGPEGHPADQEPVAPAPEG